MSLFRVSSLLVGATLFSAAMGQGCGCPPPPDDDDTPTAPTLTLTVPGTVNCDTDDAEPNTPGFQLEVTVSLNDDDGSGYGEVDVTNSRGGAPAAGTLEDGTVTVTIDVVADADAPGAENTLTASATNSDGDTITASDTVRVICADLPDVNAECHFVTPEDGDELTGSPTPVSVACTVDDEASDEQAALINAGTVTVTATNAAGDAESIQIDLVAGAGDGNLPLPTGDALTLDLVLDGSAAAFGTAVTDAIDVTVLEVVGIVVTDTLVVNAGVDNILNVADNSGEAAGNVTSDVDITFAEDATGITITVTTAPGVTCTGVGAGTTLTIAACPFVQGTNDVVVSGPGISSTGAATILDFVVDTVAPVVTISAPTEGEVLTGVDDDDAAAGFQTAVVIVSSEDGAAALTVDGNPGATGTVTGGSTTITQTLTDGAHAIVAAVTDDAGNAASSGARNVTVDSTGPSLVLAFADDTLDSSNDLDGIAANGIQVNVTVTPTGLTTGRAITIESDLDNVINAGPCVSAGDSVAVQCRVTLITDGTHEVTATATDESGNVGISNVESVDAATGLIGVSVDTPPLRNGFRSISAAEDTVAGGPAAEIVVTGETAPGGTVTLFIDGLLRDTAQADAATGAYVLNVTLTDGQTGSFEVRVQDFLATGTSGVATFRVDLGRPTAVITSPPSPATFGVAQDVPGVPGLQTNISVTVTECEDGVIEVREGNTLIGTNDTVAADGAGTFTVAISDATEGAGTWTATCTDVDGNTTASPGTLTVNVDVTAPTAPALTIVIDDLRRGVIDVRYTQPGDDANAGTITSALAFLSRDTAITDVDLGTGNQIALVVPGSATAGGAAVGPDVVQTAANLLAFDHVWHVGIRFTDDVGNRTFVTAQVNLATTETILTSAVNGYAESLSRSAGDINNDGFEDFVVGAPGINDGGDGGFEVVLGAATAGALTRTFVTPPATLTCTISPCTPREVGYAVNIIDSINGDAFDDVVVVGYDDTRFNPEIVMIYAGSAMGIAANATPASFLEATTFSFAGYHVQSVGDVDDDGDSDWVIPVQGEENVYLFLNNGSFPASGTIAARASSRIFDSGTSLFASATTSLDRGDGTNDIVVSSNTPGTLFVVRSRATWPATLDVRGGTADVGIVDIVTPDNETPGFDLQRADLDGDGDDDLLLAATGGVASLTNTAGTLSSELDWPIDVEFSIGVLGAGDFNLDGRDDICAAGSTPNALYFGVTPIAPHAADVVYGQTGLLFPLAAQVVGLGATGADYVYAVPASASVTIRN